MRIRPIFELLRGAGGYTLLWLVISATLAGVSPADSASARAQIVIRSEQPLAVLHKSQRVSDRIRKHRSSTRRISRWRPVTGTRTALPIVGRKTTKDRIRWLRVMLPGRPNGSKGWIRKRGTTSSVSRWHLLARIGDRRLHIYHRGRRVRSFDTIVGTQATPTPQGRFFVEESVRMPSGSVGGPFALALSARSNVLQEFAGGPGQVAVHGLNNVGGELGTAASHGCLRVSNKTSRWLAERIAPGARVTITR